MILLLFCEDGNTLPVRKVFDVLVKRQYDWLGKVKLYYNEYWYTDYCTPVSNYIKNMNFLINNSVKEQFGLKKFEEEFNWHGFLFIYIIRRNLFMNTLVKILRKTLITYSTIKKPISESILWIRDPMMNIRKRKVQC